MRLRRVLLALGLLGCTPEAEPPLVRDPMPEAPPVQELARASCAGVSAIWRGVDPGGEYPIEYGFESLAFHFVEGPHAGETIDFEPSGTLFFSDWRRELFSPDCRRVLLLQDRFGPYHVVGREQLPDYLLGRAAPEAILRSCTGCSSAAVHADAVWIDADTIEYEASACGTVDTLRVDLPLPPAEQAKCHERAAPR